jgi:hypothetical protein
MALVVLGVVLAGRGSAQTAIFEYDAAGNMTRASSTSSDRLNCGAVGHACSGVTSCCGGACVDTNNDPRNCGACGVVCTSKTGLICYGSCMRQCPADTCLINGVCSSCLPPPTGTMKAKP